MPDQRTAGAATQGIKKFKIINIQTKKEQEQKMLIILFYTIVLYGQLHKNIIQNIFSQYGTLKKV